MDFPQSSQCMSGLSGLKTITSCDSLSTSLHMYSVVISLQPLDHVGHLLGVLEPELPEDEGEQLARPLLLSAHVGPSEPC